MSSFSSPSITALSLLLVIFVFVPPLSAPVQDILHFEPVDCTEWLIHSTTAECGYVVVPENWTQSGEPTIRLAVVIYRAVSRNSVSDPVIFLSGGPGTRIVRIASFIMTYFSRDRDIIVYDPRGVGYSDPSLNCPEYDDLFYATLNQRLDENETALRATLDTCRERLIAAGVDLMAYNTTEMAADVNAIRMALGYEQINLYGISYGTFLAQYVMRQYPNTLRSVVLDGVLPVEVNAIEASLVHFPLALEALFATCAADQQCNDKYPDLEGRFYALVDRLNSEPVMVSQENYYTGEHYEVLIDGNRLIAVILHALGDADLIPWLPQAIHNLDAGNEHGLTELVDIGTPTVVDEGMTLSILCADIVPFNDPQVMAATIAALQQAQLRSYYAQLPPLAMGSEMRDCGHWDVPTESPGANEPVVSDIPTLVLSGAYDPVTPPAWGDLVASHLSHSYVAVIPGQAHVVLASTCARTIQRAFLQNPFTEPDTRCAEVTLDLRFR